MRRRLKFGDSFDVLVNVEGIAGLLAILVGLSWLSPKLAPILFVWMVAWVINVWFAESGFRIARYLVPVVFGLTILLLWEMIVRLMGVSPVILPPPSAALL